MAKRRRKRTVSKLSLHGALTTLETALKGPTRRDILELAFQFDNFHEALRRLRLGMSSHTFQTGSAPLVLGSMIGKYDRKTRQEGLHVLHVWHHETHRFLPGITPVLTLNYFARLPIATGSQRRFLSILLDYYFLHVLILLAIRAWDEGDPNATLDRVTQLLHDLQGPDGSGFQFADHSEALLLLAIAQYHPNEKAYYDLLKRVRTLDEFHQRRLALVVAPMLGSHLRWGFLELYGQDLKRMRKDNFVDYPWLLFAMAVLMRQYSEIRAESRDSPQRLELVLALLNGLTSDPTAFAGDPPEALSDFQLEYSDLCRLFHEFGKELLVEFERHRPSRRSYSPLGFLFNFPHNALLGMIAVALLEGSVSTLTMNALMAPERPGAAIPDSRESLARALMQFSRLPERLDTKGTVQISYDPDHGLQCFSETVRVLAAEWSRYS